MDPNKFTAKPGQTITKTEGQAETRGDSSAPTRFVPDDLDGVQRMARMFYFGGLMKKHFYKDVSPDGVRNAIAGISTMIIYGAEIGFSPTQAFRSMHVIEGAPSLSAAGKVALVKRSPKCFSFDVVEESDEHCTCETVRLRPDGSKAPKRSLTVKIWWKEPKDIPAATPSLLYVLPTYDNKGNLAPAWARTPGRMVKARCSSWLCDNVYEDVVMGLYSTEEIIDFADRRTSDRLVDDIFSMVDVAPSRPGHDEASDDPAPPVAPVPVAETVQGAASVVDVEQVKRELNTLGKRLDEASDSISAEEVAELRGKVESFNGLAPIGYGVLIKKWNANTFLGPYVVAS